MIDVSRKSWLKCLLFGSLYFSEGIELAAITVLVPIYFEEIGISLSINALIIAVSAIPWTIKFLWGGIVDYFIGFGRKRFIIVGGLLGSIGFFLLTVVNPTTALIPFACIMFIGHIGTAFLDVSADAWAIEITQENERGKINGAMFAGQYGGLAVGSSALAILANQFGYPVAFLTAGLSILLIILFPLYVHYTRPSEHHQKVFSLLVHEFKKKTTQLVALFVPFLYLSYGLLFAVMLYMKIILKLDIAQIGLITGINCAMIALGSLIGGGIIDRFGRKPALYLFITTSIVVTALLVLGTSWPIFSVLFAIIGFLQGGYTAAEGTLCMDVTNPRIGATQFSVLMSLGNIGEIMGVMVSGAVVELLGFPRLFLYAAWVFGPALLVLYYIRIIPASTQQRG
jgi:MFS family permease